MILELSALFAVVSISATQILLAILIVMTGITMYQTRDFSIFKKSYTIYFMLMILAETLSTVFGINPEHSMKDWSTFWVYFHLFTVYVIYDGKNRDAIFLFFLVGTIISLAYSFYIAAMTADDYRAAGFYSHALTYGNVMAILFIAALGFAFFTLPSEKRSRFLVLLAIAVTFACVLKSGSRGSILAMFFTSFAMIIYRYKAKGVAVTIAVIISIAVLVAAVPSASGRFSRIGKELESGSSTTSVGTRLVLWEASTKAIMSKPLFGYGKGNFREVIAPTLDVPVASMAHAHNSYIHYTFTNGFLGLVMLFMFLGALLRHMSRMSEYNPYAKTAVFVLIAFMLEGLTENNFGDSEVVMTTFLSIALLITPEKENPFRLFTKKS